jgi:hypothetical protein
MKYCIRSLMLMTVDGSSCIIARSACRMLFDGHLYGYLNLVQCSRLGACRLGYRECEITHLGTLVHSKMVTAAPSRTDLKERKGSECRTRQKKTRR